MEPTWPDDLDPFIAPELSRSALIVIDTQRDFVDGGSSPIAGTSAVLPSIRELVSAYRSANKPVVHVVRLYDGVDVDLVRRSLIATGASIARPGTEGSQIVDELRPANGPLLDPELLLSGMPQELGANEWAIWKPRWNAFHRTGLDAHLKSLNINTVVLAGCNYPNCPRASVYGASERDYKVLIVSDAISGIDARHLEEASRIGAAYAPAQIVAADVNGRRKEQV